MKNNIKQSDIINTVSNIMLRTEQKIIDGQLVTIRQPAPDSENFTRSVMFYIECEYKLHGKKFSCDPSRMIDKITKIVKENYR